MGEIEAAEVVLPCTELEATLAFFTERLGFRVAAVLPADAPEVAVIAGHGLRVRLDRRAAGSPGTLRLLCRDPAAVASGEATLVAPNGTRVELVESRPSVVLPRLRPAFVLTRLADGGWQSGRAGMLYRDLVPDRQGGRVVASHIRIPAAGPVPDYVHYHRVRFQLIYCLAGSARVVYEDQGPPFELGPGDAVLQPPEIRHRVLECAPGLEVLEVSCPAEHETHADLELELPTTELRPNRDFGGQHFVRHEVARATFAPWKAPGFEARDLGVAAATGNLASAHVVRRTPAPATSRRDPPPESRYDRLLFTFVLAGSARLHGAGASVEHVAAGDAFTIPPGHVHSLQECASDLELLELAIDPLRS